MPELGLLQTQYALVDLFLQQLSGIFIVHQFSHSRRQQALVVELLVLAFAAPLSAVLSVVVAAGSARELLGVLGLSRIGLIMEKAIVPELLLDVLHALVDFCAASFLSDLDPIGSEIDLLLPASLPVEVPILREVLLAEVILWATAEAARRHGFLLENSERAFGTIVRREQRITSFPHADIVDDLLRLGRHLVRRVLYHFSQSQNHWNNVHRDAHRHVSLILWRRVAAQLVFLIKIQ